MAMQKSIAIIYRYLIIITQTIIIIRVMHIRLVIHIRVIVWIESPLITLNSVAWLFQAVLGLGFNISASGYCSWKAGD